MTEAAKTTETKTTETLKMREPKTFVLPKSRVTVVYDADPSVSQVIAAQKAAAKDTAKFVLYLAQATATFDGRQLTMGEIMDAIRGRDYLALAGEMLGEAEEAGAGN